MSKLERFDLLWLTGPNCDGCTIKALGETTGGGLEALLTGRVPELPHVYLTHPVLSVETGAAFTERLRRAERGELGPFGIVNEGSVTSDELAGSGFFATLGEEEGRPITIKNWLDRLARRAAFVIAWGDCAVWGGPHSLAPNPTGSTGTAMYLGTDYRSALGLPVLNLPGCAAPSVLVATLVALLKWVQGQGPLPELDDTNRPKFAYSDVWKGAFVAWSG